VFPVSKCVYIYVYTYIIYEVYIRHISIHADTYTINRMPFFVSIFRVACGCMSCFEFRDFRVVFRISDVVLRISYFVLHIPHFMFRISHLQFVFHISHFVVRMLGFRFPYIVFIVVGFRVSYIVVHVHLSVVFIFRDSHVALHMSYFVGRG
jgi:hypothetical protein